MQQLLDQLFRAVHLPPTGSATADALTARFSAISYECSLLDIPEYFRDEWSAFSEILEGVKPLFEQLGDLERGQEPLSPNAVMRLQKAFAAEIDRMNQVERRLLDKERELAGT